MAKIQIKTTEKEKSNQKQEMVHLYPKRVDMISVNEKEATPVFVFMVEDRKGYVPVWEAGAEIFRGSQEDFFSLSEEERNQHRRWMIRALTSKEPFALIVKGTENGYLWLSRSEAQKMRGEETLKNKGIDDLNNFVGETIEAFVTVPDDDMAYLDLGGLLGVMQRSEVDYTNKKPARAFNSGEWVSVKIIGIREDGVLEVSRKATLPDPWDNIDFDAGSVVRGKVINNSSKANNILVVAFEEGLVGHVKYNFQGYVPTRFEDVAVRIDFVDRKNRKIMGKIIS